MLNDVQIKILKFTVGCIGLMLLFPPFSLIYPDGKVQNVGYDFILSSNDAIVNVPLLITQWFGVLLITGLLWFITKGKQ